MSPTETDYNRTDELARLFTGSNAREGEVDVVTSSDELTESGVHPNGIGLAPSASAGQLISDVAAPPTPTVPGNTTSLTAVLNSKLTIRPNSEVSHTQTDTSVAVPDTKAGTHRLQHPLFSVDQLRVDRRLLLNRKRQLKMYRVWMQAKFRKL